MIKNIYLRIISISLPGILLPVISGIISYDNYSFSQLLISHIFFILISFLIWKGCNWIHTTVRPMYSPVQHLSRRILSICFACSVYSTCICCLAALSWMKFADDYFNFTNLLWFVTGSSMAVVIFTLIYEILFLVEEKERDIMRVALLNEERSQAELHALQNEMDPHFLFNALNTLNYLILNNPTQASLFNNKLAQVYKYFLLNKNKKLIPLEDELDFVDNYFFLLQLRYEQKLQLDIQLKHFSSSDIKIPPCSLQILLENAIKHNSFSKDEPLVIIITISGQYIRVANKIRPKPYIIDSTQVGLNNLSSRYKLLFNKDIIVNPGKEQFAVNLPVIR